MKAIKLVSVLALATATLVPAAAFAQPAEENLESHAGVDHALAPVTHAFELGISTGYAQGGGKLGGGMRNLEDVAGPGGAIELDAGYRIIPHLAVGLYGTFQKNQHGDLLDSSTNVLGATAGVQATWHFRPAMSVDPWVSLGTGWKGLWLDPNAGKTTSIQGLQLARLQVGADYRVSRDVAIAPVLGASIDMFVSQDSPMTTDYTEIKDKKVSFSGFAGLSGRFDVGGRR